MSFCRFCGTENNENAKFCNNCGQVIAQQQAVAYEQQNVQPVNQEVQQYGQPMMYGQQPVVNNVYLPPNRPKPYTSFRKVPPTPAFYIAVLSLFLTIAGIFFPWVAFEDYRGESDSVSLAKIVFSDSDSDDSDETGNILGVSDDYYNVGVTIACFALFIMLPILAFATSVKFIAGLALLEFIMFLASLISTFTDCNKVNDKIGWIEESSPGIGIWLMVVLSLISTICGYIDYAMRRAVYLNSQRYR